MLTMDQLYEDIGGFGKFQAFVIVGLLSNYAVSGWSLGQMAFSGIVPDWYCVIYTSNQSNVRNQSAGIQQYEALFQSELQTPFISSDDGYVMNVSRQVCSINNITCDAFWFDTPPYTIVSQWDLVCDLKWVPQALPSIQFAGVLVGAFISSQIGDRFGRKKLVYAALLAHTLFNVITGFSVSWVMFAVCLFFVGLGIGLFLAGFLPYVLEFFPSKWFHRLTMIPFSIVGSAIFAGAAFLLQNWAHVQFALASLNAPFLLGWFFFPESPRWLSVHGRGEEALQVLGRMARINGKALPDKAALVMKSIADAEIRSRQNKKYTYIDLFRTWKSTRITCFICFMWPAITSIFTGLALGVSNLAGDMYLNLFLMNIVGLPLNLLMLCVVNKTGIRLAVLSMFLMCTAGAAGCIGATSTGEGMAVTVCALCAKMALTAAFGLVQMWSAVLYPTVLRSRAYGLFNMMAKLGSMVSPYIINLNERALVSYIIMTCTTGICVCLSIGLPETTGTALADTMNTEDDVKVRDEEERNLLRTSMEQQQQSNYGMTDSKGRDDSP